MGSGRKPRGTCPRCRTKKYTLAFHSVKIFMDGTVIDPQEVNQEDVKNMPKDKRNHAQFEFSGDNIANRVLDWIREYVTTLGMLGKADRKKGKGGNFWQQSDRSQLATAVLKLCAEAEKIFKHEPRVLKVNSPIYVLGDIHGNLHDLMVYERSLWDKGPCCTAASYLFLGDYVDRGDYGLEVVLYLLCCKVLAPDKFFLLRGNHELRPIQMVFTFQREC
ncbi:serine/threonine protein phosphatase-like protein 6, partial [Leptotrombidium deliense]